jgi:hypothetical protein
VIICWIVNIFIIAKTKPKLTKPAIN